MRKWYNIYFESRNGKYRFTEYLHHRKIKFETSGCGNGYIVNVKLNENELASCNRFLEMEHINR